MFCFHSKTSCQAALTFQIITVIDSPREAAGPVPVAAMSLYLCLSPSPPCGHYPSCAVVPGMYLCITPPSLWLGGEQRSGIDTGARVPGGPKSPSRFGICDSRASRRFCPSPGSAASRMSPDQPVITNTLAGQTRAGVHPTAMWRDTEPKQGEEARVVADPTACAAQPRPTSLCAHLCARIHRGARAASRPSREGRRWVAPAAFSSSNGGHCRRSCQ